MINTILLTIYIFIQWLADIGYRRNLVYPIRRLLNIQFIQHSAYLSFPSYTSISFDTNAKLDRASVTLPKHPVCSMP